MRRHQSADGEALPGSTCCQEDLARKGWAQWTRVEDATYSFWAAHTEEASQRVLSILCVVGPVLPCMALTHVVFNGVDKNKIPRLFPYVLFCSGVWLFKQRWQRLMKQWPVAVGSLLQVFWHLLVSVGAIDASSSMPSDLLQHRMFLGIYSASLVVAVSFYVPTPLYFGFVCPLYFGGWLFFHGAVGFLPVSCILWGMLLVALCAYLHKLQSKCLWREFQAVAALEKQTCALEEKTKALQKESQLLQAARESLHGLLSSISDASCVCDQHGKLLNCSPQLRQILDCPPQSNRSMESDDSQVGLNLCSFAATESERDRLRDFLEKSCTLAHHRASAIQCSFRSAATDAPSALIEAQMYAIVMPDTDREADALFIALLTQSAVPLKEASSESDRPNSVTYTIGAPLDNESDDFCATSGAGCLWQLGDASVADLANVVEPAIGQRLWSNHQESEVSFALSASTRRARETTQEVEVQTEALEIAGESGIGAQTRDTMPVLRCKGIQTEKPARCPRLPGLRLPVFGTGKRVLRQFKETPMETLDQMVLQLMVRVNPRGKGCCFKHICLVTLHRTVSRMVMEKCLADLQPNNKWQCGVCLAVHEDEDDMEESGRVCDVCSHEDGSCDNSEREDELIEPESPIGLSDEGSAASSSQYVR